MSDSQHRATHDSALDAAGFTPPVIGRGSGMTLKEMGRRLKDYCRSKGDQARLGWQTFAQKKAALKRQAQKNARAQAALARRPLARSAVVKALDFQKLRQHRPATGVRKFMARGNDPWSQL